LSSLHGGPLKYTLIVKGQFHPKTAELRSPWTSYTNSNFS